MARMDSPTVQRAIMRSAVPKRRSGNSPLKTAAPDASSASPALFKNPGHLRLQCPKPLVALPDLPLTGNAREFGSSHEHFVSFHDKPEPKTLRKKNEMKKDFIAELKKTKGILILGHRGCRNSDVPENTMAAFQKAFDVGADGIEIDVETTFDNQLVVVNRWYLKKHFDFFPWERELSYIQSQGKQKGIIIPTFDAVCEFIKEKPNFIFNVEIKSSDIGICRTAKQATKRIYDFGIQGQVILSSFDINTLLTSKFHHPNLETAYLFRKEDRVVDIQDKKTFKYKINGLINRSGIKALLAATDTIHPEIALFKNGKKSLWQYNRLLTKKNINAWTVDSHNDYEKAIENEVDIIISDDPGKMVEYRDGSSPTKLERNHRDKRLQNSGIQHRRSAENKEGTYAD